MHLWLVYHDFDDEVLLIGGGFRFIFSWSLFNELFNLNHFNLFHATPRHSQIRVLLLNARENLVLDENGALQTVALTTYNL